MKNTNLLILFIIFTSAIACENESKTETEKYNYLNDTLSLSCTINGEKFHDGYGSGGGISSRQLMKIENNTKDSFNLCVRKSWGDNLFGITIYFAKNMFVDTNVFSYSYAFQYDLDITSQILAPGQRKFSEIATEQTGIYIEIYRVEKLENPYSTPTYTHWISFLKQYSYDNGSLAFTVNNFQEGSSFEIIEFDTVTGHFEAIFNCSLYNYANGETDQLTDGHIHGKAWYSY